MRWRASLFLFAAAALGGCAAPVRGPFTSYTAYYGHDRFEDLAKNGLVVLQPYAYTPEDIAALRAKGVTVLAYITLGEDDALRRDDGTGLGGQAPWYLDEFTGPGFTTPGPDGKPDLNAAWNSYYVDPGHPRWRRRVLHQIRALRRQGFDGLFLDTILLPTDVFTAATEARMTDGLRDLLRAVRRAWRRGYILANNAPLEDPVQISFFNGVMLESVLLSDDMGAARRQLRQAAVRRAGGRPLDVFTLDYGRAGTVDAWCAAADAAPFLAAFMPDTPEGRNLTVFPFRVCGRSR